jgi:hypothetical protein
MQTTSLWKRLRDAFNPPVALPPPLPALVQWTGSEKEFFEYLDKREFISIPDDTESPRTFMYVDGKTSETFAIAVRWPNRYYYYLLN